MRRMLGLFLMLLLTSAVSADLSGKEGDLLNLDWMDLSVKPSDDFFTYANGTWQKNNPIPLHYSTWGTFYVLNDEVQKRIHQLLIKAAKPSQAKVDSTEQKVGDFYFSGMDETTIDSLGVTPLTPDFAKIDAIHDKTSLFKSITDLQMLGVPVLFQFGSMQDFADSRSVIATAMQGGIGLPDRDYYLKKSEKFQKIREAYLQYIEQMFTLLGHSPKQSQEMAKVIMRIETKLAEASLTQIEQRDPRAIYHMMDTQELCRLTPHFSWTDYFNAMHLTKPTKINVGMPLFFKTMDHLLATLPLNEWKIYLSWHLLNDYAPYLSKPYVDAQFQMSSAITGTKKILPRWQRVTNAANANLGFAVGKMYVEQYFPPSSKQEVLAIVKNIRAALQQDLQTLSWMTPKTRIAALEKLRLMGEHIGYPERWWDYSTLKIDRTAYVDNIKRAQTFLVKRDLRKIGKPLDRTEWAMPPQTVNAYYDPSMNDIYFPAGILQPPFFNPQAPEAINYGAIGFVIGHELTHGFDDQGAKFDGHGNLKNWWTPLDLKRFEAATHCIMDQFSQYVVMGDLHVQGKLVMGEATADLGGLTLAYRAFHASHTYKKAKTIAGFTPDQQFFLGAAHVWTSNVRPEQMRHLITVDPHPPMIYRVNGTVANMPEFQAAFAIPKNSPMFNPKACTIW